ncbi:G protein-coupled receptor kinase 4 [Capsaspora owczarzaki ATCC 30864]|uniref:G protein-coupled receptor kinase n=1 Tax=Capsaspora owczarzaki (strain ATCC 30864) TaxID=595528 RepID=A0A0D2WW32_CAPO3|nr:G protein-coupled receptor kinase 4 [Capsaspora owczarzaki ATCC 30864]KJE96608.1 AGC/GRK/GRK protein kinase [Capsaspora owczarzaki ATCC 30864]|eukprot:XP_004344529.2 G protein-coupled receptor kinase 4 [Capsaspora owczarzaki ATCC 30864]
MMDLENIVANTQLIKAMEGKGKSKKWKEMLRFPHIRQCAELERELNAAGELTLDAVCKSEIGKRLFLTHFCGSSPAYKPYSTFLADVESFRLAPQTEQRAKAKSVYDSLSKSSQLPVVPQAVIGEIGQKLGESTVSSQVFEPAELLVRQHLAGKPFDEFRASHWYSRLLQWKWLSRRPVDRDSFRFYRVLGKGGFGEVHACQKRDTGKMYAVKCLDKKRIKKKKGEQLAWNERDLLAKVNSRFIVGLKYAFVTKEQLCMVLDLMNGGDLQFHLSFCTVFEEERARFYAAEMILGLQHLHQNNLLYRDMKPENMLLNEEGHVCLSDLGLAVELKPPKLVVKGRVGTPGYMAPEVINGEKYGVSADWWGLGCVLYDMICGHSPFRARKEKLRVDKLQQRVLEAVIEYDSHFTPESKDLCMRLLERDYTKRLGCMGGDAEELKRHPFFASIDWVRLEAGLIPSPCKPSAHQVNAKDVLDIDRFDSIKDVKLTEDDTENYSKFPMVASSCWEAEIVETVFEEHNRISEPLPSDLRQDVTVEQYIAEPLGFFSKLKMKFGRSRNPSLDSDSSSPDLAQSSSSQGASTSAARSAA